MGASIRLSMYVSINISCIAVCMCLSMHRHIWVHRSVYLSIIIDRYINVYNSSLVDTYMNVQV